MGQDQSSEKKEEEISEEDFYGQTITPNGIYASIIYDTSGTTWISSDGQFRGAGGVNTTGAITGTSLTTNGGAITGGAITGKSLTTTNGVITGGAITGTSLTTTNGAISQGGAITGTSLTTTNGAITGGSITGTSLTTTNGAISQGGAITGTSLTTTNGGAISGGAITGTSLTTTNGGAISGGAITGTSLCMGGNCINSTHFQALYQLLTGDAGGGGAVLNRTTTNGLAGYNGRIGIYGSGYIATASGGADSSSTWYLSTRS